MRANLLVIINVSILLRVRIRESSLCSRLLASSLCETVTRTALLNAPNRATTTEVAT
jgi:hypothetical protein